MKKNMGTTDRSLRVIAAAIIAALYYTGQISGTLAIVGLIIAGIFILTSFVAVCPLYWPFRFSTRNREQKTT